VPSAALRLTTTRLQRKATCLQRKATCLPRDRSAQSRCECAAVGCVCCTTGRHVQARKWKQTNSAVISSIWSSVRFDLRSDWLGSESAAQVGQAAALLVLAMAPVAAAPRPSAVRSPLSTR
jgi:hypothetical protein